MMKRLAMILGMFLAGNVLAEDVSKPVPPPFINDLKPDNKPSNIPLKPTLVSKNIEEKTAEPLTNFTMPTESTRKTIWAQCQELSQKGKTYQYLEGTVVSKSSQPINMMPGDRVCDTASGKAFCRPEQLKNDIYFYDLELVIRGKRTNASLVGTIQQLQTSGSKIKIGKSYIFCAHFWSIQGQSNYVIDDLSTFKSVE